MKGLRTSLGLKAEQDTGMLNGRCLSVYRFYWCYFSCH